MFPAIGFFAVAARQAGDLVEVAADDAAVRRAHRLTVAGALMAVAGRGIPSGVLGAGGIAATRRIRRLIDPAADQHGGLSPPPRWPRRRALAVAVFEPAMLAMTRCPRAGGAFW